MHLFLCYTPCFAVIRITLIEKVGSFVFVSEQVGMPALATVPLAWFAVRFERLVA